MSKNIASILGGSFESKEVLCPIHGSYSSVCMFGRWTDCFHCSDGNTENRRVSDAEIEEKNRETAKLRISIKNANIPKKYEEVSINNYNCENIDQKNMLSYVSKYISLMSEKNPPCRSLLFTGNPGTGKTHLACAIAIDFIKRGKRTYYTTVQRLLRRIKESWDKESKESESSIINELRCVDLLVLDELGVHISSDFSQNIIYDILDYRCSDLNPTIFISNLDKNTIQEIIGYRAIDRIRENGGKLLVFAWDSYRKKQIE